MSRDELNHFHWFIMGICDKNTSINNMARNENLAGLEKFAKKVIAPKFPKATFIQIMGFMVGYLQMSEQVCLKYV